MNSITENMMLASTLTIAETMRMVAGWTDLPAARLVKFKTALATAARVLAPAQGPAMAAANILMDCPSLSRLLQAPPATFGLSQGRMYSLASELRAILRRLGHHDVDVRGAELGSLKLAACRDLLPEERQRSVIDFLRYLDGEQIAPEDADGAALAAYQDRWPPARCAPIPPPVPAWLPPPGTGPA